MRKFTTFVLTVLVLGGALAALPALAAPQPLRVEPSRFIFQGKPGEEITGSIQVFNKGTETAAAKAVLLDWSLSPQNQVVTYVGGTLDSSLSGWVKFNPRQFSLKPKNGQTVRFTVRIPRDAKPGERRGSLAFEQSAPLEGQYTGASVKVQVTATIYVSVLPVERKCEVVDAKVAVRPADGLTAVLLDLKGTGNAHFRGTGEFQLFRDGEKTPMAEGAFEPLVVLPGVVTQFAATWKGQPDPGKYQVGVRIQSEEPNVAPLIKIYEYIHK